MINFKNLKPKSNFPQLISSAVILLALVFAGTLSFVLSKNINPVNPQITETKKVIVVKKSVITPTPVPENAVITEKTKTQSGTAESNVSYTVITTSAPVATTVSTSTSTEGTQTTANTNSATESKVNVSVTGSSSFEVKINDSSNQCDVLTKALEQGKIQSLNMRYDNSLGSFAVYQINGIGKDNSVWWTYKVNGQSPSQGCSYVKANNGDNIEWKYIGS